jgi:hypothetical protein
LFPCKARFCSFARANKEDGNFPVKSQAFKAKDVNELANPTSLGIVPPNNLLVATLITAIFELANSEEGRVPLKLFVDIVKEVSALKLTIDDGIVPLIALFGRLIPLTLGGAHAIPVHVQTSDEGTPLLHCQPEIPLKVGPRLVAANKSHIAASCSVGALVGALVGEIVGILDGMKVVLSTRVD